MLKLRAPKCTGREMRDSYVAHRGPGNIPKSEKWKQHMLTSSENLLEFCRERIGDNDEDVAGWGDQESSRLSTACYCEQAFSIVLYLAYKYHDDPKKALLQNVMIGGHSTSRGSVLGAVMGAAHPTDLPFVNDLCAYSSIKQEVQALC